MDILFNSEGTPLLMESDSAFFDTKLDRQAADSRRRVLFPYDDTKHDFLEVLGYRVLSWGRDNVFPWHAAKIVRNTTVLNTGLRFLRNLTMGQGIFACRVTGYNDKGDEILEPVSDTTIQRFVQSRLVRRYMEKSAARLLEAWDAALCSSCRTCREIRSLGLTPSIVRTSALRSRAIWENRCVW